MPTLSGFSAAHAEIAHERVEDEVIVINLRTGAYFSLIGAAADAWDLLLTRTALDDVAAAIAGRYRVEVATVRTDLEPFVRSLVDEGLLVATDATPTAAALADQAPAVEPTYRPPMLEKYDDMEELLLLDPIHEVDEAGWPVVAAEPADG
ncbi:MAG: PqqD family protein [Acidimicrobiia bacterium]|nr:PqqD family protein [Acidimicrobiia bacterium]